MNRKAQKTILLVEDEAVIALDQARTLKGFGFKVLTAGTGENAVELALGNPDIDLILMDIDLGRGINGPAAAARILDKRTIPIVFLTAHAEREMVETVRGITRYGYVIKNSGDFVLQSSIEMAFELFEAHERTREREAALLKNQALLNEMGRMAKVGGWEFDVEKQELRWTEEIYGIYEVDPGFVPTFENSLGFLIPDSRKLLRQAVRRLMETGEPFDLELELITGRGRRRWIRIQARAEYANGKISRRMGITQDVTERKLAELTLKKSQNLLNSMSRLGNIGGWEYDIEKREMHWTDETYNIYEVDPAAYVPSLEKAMDFYTPDSRKKIEQARARMMESDESWDEEVEIITAKGTRRWVRIMGKAERENEKVVKRVGITQDITKRKQAEAALQRHEMLLREMGAMAKVGGWEYNLGEPASYWTEEQYKLFEVDPSVIPSVEGATSFYAPGSKERLIQARRRLMETGEPYDLESEIITAKGKHRWIHHTGRAKYGGGKLVGRMGITQDITAYKQIEQSLRDSEGKYRVVYENEINAIYIFEIGNLKILDVNESFTRLYGYSRDEAISGKTIYDISAEEEATRVSVESVVRAGSLFIPLRYHRKKDGTIFPVEIVNGAGEWKGRRVIFGLAHDITDRKRAEDEIKALLDEKELRFKEVHHRVKNNLSIMMSIFSLQSQMMKDPSSAQAMADAQNRLRSMGVLYDKLYRSGSSGEMSIAEYFPPLIAEIVGIFPDRAFVRTAIKIDGFTLGEKELSALGIIANELITNMMKHAFAGRDRGLISISAAKKADQVTIEIGDDGVGLPESIDIENSTGFGLLLVSTLMKQLNGSITIDRRNGTRFVLQFRV